MKEIDISGEEFRVYTYADGQTFQINEPISVCITESGSHRVVDAKGMTHRPTPGWIGLSWKPKPGEPAFVA